MKPHPLRLAREERGWSQTKVAKELGVNLRTVGRWELRLVVPHPHYREQLSLLFGKTIEELGLLEDGGENKVNRSPWHPPLIASTTLLIVLIIIAMLLAFNGLPFHGSVQVITRPIAQPPSSEAPAITVSGTSYEAEAPGNTITGGAIVASCAVCSGKKQVGDIGHTGTLQINNVREKTAGQYTLTIYYLYGNIGSRRNLHVTVNNKKSTTITVSAMNSWDEIGTLHTGISLNAGNNTIEFSNRWGVTPNIDRIVISPT